MTDIDKVIEQLHERGLLEDLIDKRLTTNKLPVQLYIRLVRAAIAVNKDVTDVISTALHTYVNKNDTIHDSELKAKSLAQGKTVEELLVDILEERIGKTKRKQGAGDEV